MGKIVVVGSFVMDFIFETMKRPVKGETVVGKSFSTAPGGKGANQAMQAALLGADAAAVGRVGDDVYGSEILDSLSGAGVDVRWVKKDSAGTACSAVVLDAEGDNSIVMVPRANMNFEPLDLDDAIPLIESADTIIIQLEIPVQVNEKTVRLARRLRKRIILDPAPACELDDFFYKNVDIMTPNETEATMLSGIDVVDVDSAEKAAAVIAARVLKTVIITMGGNGTLLYDEDGVAFFPPVPVDVKDTTAAGDSFTGSLAVFLDEGKDIREAVELSGCVAALSTTKLGAQPSLPDRAAFECFVETIE